MGNATSKCEKPDRFWFPNFGLPKVTSVAMNDQWTFRDKTYSIFKRCNDVEGSERRKKRGRLVKSKKF
jgi:hypothetical protein